MGALQTGLRLQTVFGKEVRVLRQLGAGGQGAVYEITYGGARKALKWLFEDVMLDKGKFTENLRSNIQTGPPNKGKLDSKSTIFLWPQDMVQTSDGGLGYVMDLCPSGWLQLSDILMDPGQVDDYYGRVTDVSLNLADSFNVLHNAGLCYQDINDGNFFMDPKPGRLCVAICDCDNVAPPNVDIGILGHPDFMAPEVVTRQSKPTIQSDLHSLAVLLYYLLVFAHPLVGRRGARRYDGIDMHLFGADPLFVFDPTDASNRPMKNDDNSRINWSCLPSHMKDIFGRAFSKEALRNPGRRPKEGDWLRELALFRSEIVTCRHCGNEVFLEGVDFGECDRCHRRLKAHLRFDVVFPGRSEPLVPIVRDARIYACQLGLRGDVRPLDRVVQVVASKNNPGMLGIVNTRQTPIEARLGSETRTLSGGQVVRAVDGVMLRVPEMREGEYLRISKNP